MPTMVDCAACDGTGRIAQAKALTDFKLSECDMCEGTGLVPLRAMSTEECVDLVYNQLTRAGVTLSREHADAAVRDLFTAMSLSDGVLSRTERRYATTEVG